MNKTIAVLVDKILNALAELSQEKNSDFIIGERYAYIEFLEILQQIIGPQASGLDFDIEKKFPLE